jgi:hypothetical protein
MSENTLAASRAPFAGLYDFVKTHLVVVNAVVVASGTVVGALDFLAPRLSFMPAAVYSATAALAALMLVAAFAPGMISKAGSALGFSFSNGGVPLWRRPAWQFLVALLLGMTALGFASVAKASDGGLLVSRFPAAREWQASLLGLRRDVAEISRGVADANGKLDALVAQSLDPQKDLVARGYAYDQFGLDKAIRQADLRALGLFAKAGYRAEGRAPIVALLIGSQRWSAQVASALPASMFGTAVACDDADTLNYELKEPVAERLALYKRLCGEAASIGRLRRMVAAAHGDAPGTPYEERQRRARRGNLAALTSQ